MRCECLPNEGVVGQSAVDPLRMKGQEYKKSVVREMEYECPKCRNTEHPIGSNFCKICGMKIELKMMENNAKSPRSKYAPGEDWSTWLFKENKFFDIWLPIISLVLSIVLLMIILNKK